MILLLLYICVTLNLFSSEYNEQYFMMGLETANPIPIQKALGNGFTIPKHLSVVTYRPQTHSATHVQVTPLDYLLQANEHSDQVSTIATIAQQLGFNETQLLLKALEKKNSRLATYLLNKQTHINLETAESTQLFSHCLAYGNIPASKSIIEKHSGPWEQLSHLVTLAVSYNSPEIAQLLVNKPINLNARAVFNVSPLSAAVEQNNAALAKYLLSNGALCTSQEASTLLFKAARNNNQELVKILLDCGADTRGMSEFAKAHGHTKIAGHIKEYEIAQLDILSSHAIQ